MALWSILLPVTVAVANDPPAADTFPLEAGISCEAANDQPRTPYINRLTPEQESRALALYRRAVIITTHDHCHNPHDYLDAAKAGITARTIKPLTDGYYRRGPARFPIEEPLVGWDARGRAMLALMNKQAEESHGKIRIIRSVADIEKIKRDGAQGVILSFEGGRPLTGKLENVAMFHQLGLRELQLHWAVPSPLKTADGGLSEFGKDVIREANRVGLLVDISHMPERNFVSALETTRRPVVISHCAITFTPKTERPNTDRLDDETIRRIAANRGIISLHFLEGYVQPRRGKQHASVEDLVDEIDHIKKVAGIDWIALGPDYSPMKGWRWIEGAESYAGMPNVVRELVSRGYTNEEIEKVLGRNLIRLYTEVWKE
jgi:membrane dipeptidase